VPWQVEAAEGIFRFRSFQHALTRLLRHSVSDRFTVRVPRSRFSIDHGSAFNSPCLRPVRIAVISSAFSNPGSAATMIFSVPTRCKLRRLGSRTNVRAWSPPHPGRGQESLLAPRLRSPQVFSGAPRALLLSSGSL